MNKTLIDYIKQARMTEEERDRRRLDEIEHLRQRGVATYADEAEAFNLRRRAAKREFHGGRHG